MPFRATALKSGWSYLRSLADFQAGTTRMVFEGMYRYAAHDWSPDGRWIVMSEAVGEDSNTLHLLDVERGALLELFAPERRASFGVGLENDARFAWVSDSSGFFFTSNHQREFQALVFYRLQDERRQSKAVQAVHDTYCYSALGRSTVAGTVLEAVAQSREGTLSQRSASR